MCQIEIVIRLKESDGQVVSETMLATQVFDLLDVEAIPRPDGLTGWRKSPSKKVGTSCANSS